MFRWSIYSPLSSYLCSLGTIAVVGMGGYMLMQNSGFSFGQFLAFFAYCSMLYEPVTRLNGLNHMLSQAKASGERVFDILDQPLIIQDPKLPKPFPKGLLEVCYKSAYFSYAGRSEIIEGLNLILPSGKITALVGHTGAGKSTIANLLLRYYDIDKGSVEINGVDVRSINLTELRSNIGFVAQDPFLFDGTVKDNLRLARENTTDDEIISALKGSRSWEFVNRLPNGINTAIGERGIRLSMGEKQRLTIARVLLKNPPLIILDEATSSVDSITEKAIQEALNLLIKNRTVLVIAHRLSTVRRADHIVVLDHGRIIEQGNHDKLLEKDGQYAELWHPQQNLIPETI